MNSRSRRIGRVTVLIGLLLAFSGTACSIGPTSPTYEDEIGIYTGQWRGNIGGFEVVLYVRANRSSGGGLDFAGTGTARSATGESHRLGIDGGAFVSSGFYIMVERGGESGPASLSLITTGHFDGEVSRDGRGRTWEGRFTSETRPGGAPIFGPGEYSVTLIKELGPGGRAL